jgi:hypothetical protein
MKDADNAGAPRVPHDRAGIVFGIPSVHHHGPIHLFSERDLSRERGALGFTWGIVVVVVESAFADRHGSIPEQRAQLREVALGVKRRCVVGMNAGGRKDEPGIVRGALGGNRRRRERLPDADDRQRARIAGARDYRVAVAGEGRVREVGVAVDED